MMQSEYSNYYLLPSTLYVSMDPVQVTTVLGSCVAVCLWDKKLEYGGINHYMLPFWNGKGLASPKYGNIAIMKLLDKMIEMGSNKKDIIAKVFGGGEILESKSADFKIGSRNIEVAFETLEEINIPVIASSTGGTNGRKIVFDTIKGTVNHKYIEKTCQTYQYASTKNN